MIVEVSSNGTDFIRFPATTELLNSSQIGSFENMDATYFDNLAGKYIANYGVPFDLSELPDTSILDKQNITHIKLVDVIGTIDTAYASFDQFGNPINDPWPTNFASGGFDLDAVGIIHSKIPLAIEDIERRMKRSEMIFQYDYLGRVVGSINSSK